MTRSKLEIPYQQISLETLPEKERKLAEMARGACRSSYAPYSRFRVGAAAILDDGTVLTASNQESEVFPSGMCAERILLYKCQSDFSERIIEAVAITSEKEAAPSISEVYPCGSCAQIFVDTEKRQQTPIRVIMCGAGSCTIINSAKHLLPFTFEL